jgi:SAM-dependent methyltransferase
MKATFEFYSGTYRDFAEELYDQIRKETHGEDIGQNSWLTANEYRGLFTLLKLSSRKKILEVASGSGGPAIFMVKETGCHLTGIDISESGIATAQKSAMQNGVKEKTKFLKADGAEPLSFDDESFDVVICMDSMNHLKNRDKVLKEFRRVLKSGGRLLYTDPVVVTGAVTNEELMVRSSVGFFLFMPPGENERLLKQAGFTKIKMRDVTDSMADVSINWHIAREKRKDALVQVEGAESFKGFQSFFYMVHLLSSERRLSRLMFTAVK